jgi:MSHA pilin protein MshA
MKRHQAGFTMIELIVVIVILGVLAATALPKFIDVQENAEESSLKGVAGSLASAMSVNYGGCLVMSHAATAGKCITVDNCDDAESLLQSTVDDYTVTAAALAANGTSVSCTVTQDLTGDTATFTGIGAGQP